MMPLEEIEAALDESGLRWVRRGASWAVVDARVPCEVAVTPQEDGVRVEAVLVEWDTADDAAVRALSMLLKLAASELRNCRGAIEGRRACLVARAGEEQGLVRGLRGVAAGCQGLTREARALLGSGLAAAFLEFQGQA
jgi:hypothetical protein